MPKKKNPFRCSVTHYLLHCCNLLGISCKQVLRTQRYLPVPGWSVWGLGLRTSRGWAADIIGVFQRLSEWCLLIVLAVSRWLHWSPVVHRVWGGCGGAGAGALTWSGPGGVCWVRRTVTVVTSIRFCGSFNLVGIHLSKAGCKLCGSKQTIHI